MSVRAVVTYLAKYEQSTRVPRLIYAKSDNRSAEQTTKKIERKMRKTANTTAPKCHTKNDNDMQPRTPSNKLLFYYKYFCATAGARLLCARNARIYRAIQRVV